VKEDNPKEAKKFQGCLQCQIKHYSAISNGIIQDLSWVVERKKASSVGNAIGTVNGESREKVTQLIGRKKDSESLK
jgi:hypothetical protein